MKKYESRLIPVSSGQIAYFNFPESSGQESFAVGLEELKKMIQNPSVKYLLVNVSINSAWNKEGQQVWVDTGVLAEEVGIKKWGVVSNEKAKQITIKYLINGAGGKRKYETLVTDNEKECLEWMNN